MVSVVQNVKGNGINIQILYKEEAASMMRTILTGGKNQQKKQGSVAHFHSLYLTDIFKRDWINKRYMFTVWRMLKDSPIWGAK